MRLFFATSLQTVSFAHGLGFLFTSSCSRGRRPQRTLRCSASTVALVASVDFMEGGSGRSLWETAAPPRFIAAMLAARVWRDSVSITEHRDRGVALRSVSPYAFPGGLGCVRLGCSRCGGEQQALLSVAYQNAGRLSGHCAATHILEGVDGVHNRNPTGPLLNLQRNWHTDRKFILLLGLLSRWDAVRGRSSEARRQLPQQPCLLGTLCKCIL